MASLPTTRSTMDTQQPSSEPETDPQQIFYFAVSSVLLLCAVALLVWYFCCSCYCRSRANAQRASIPMNPLTRPPPPNDLEANLRMDTIHEEGPSASSGATATTNVSPETTKAAEDPGFPRLFELEKKNMMDIMGKNRLTDLEARACKGKVLGAINSRNNQEESERWSKMSRRTQDEIKGKEGLKADAINMVGPDPFDNNYAVKGVGGEEHVVKKTRLEPSVWVTKRTEG
ncbi:hypothetical protein Vi05172_g3855 [Venturia inaequalis]|nr:hypothetical protein Vi05172_g3855 [Venturia inaequalis]